MFIIPHHVVFSVHIQSLRNRSAISSVGHTTANSSITEEEEWVTWLLLQEIFVHPNCSVNCGVRDLIWVYLSSALLRTSVPSVWVHSVLSFFLRFFLLFWWGFSFFAYLRLNRFLALEFGYISFCLLGDEFVDDDDVDEDDLAKNATPNWYTTPVDAVQKMRRCEYSINDHRTAGSDLYLKFSKYHIE